MNSAPVRVFMLSKACIVGIYQRKLELMARDAQLDLRVAVPPSWRDERGEQALERVYTQGYDLRTLPIALNGNFHLHYYPHLGREICQFQPHIVHIDEEPYNVATWQALYWARRVGAKTLFFSWQNILRHYPPPFAWGEAWVLRQIDYALMGTESAAQVWRAKGYTGEMAIIPQFGTDTQLFHAHTPPASRPFTIGFVGRLVEEKGVYILLDALAGLQGEWRAHWVGGGPLRAALEQRASELGIAERLSFLGQVPSTEMPHIYPSFDVLVLPSLTRPNWKEQFGRALIEAMACGVPVIGSDSGAIPDVIGSAGMVVPEASSLALWRALTQLQSELQLRQQYAQAGRQRVLEHFTHEQIAEQTLAVYRQML